MAICGHRFGLSSKPRYFFTYVHIAFKNGIWKVPRCARSLCAAEISNSCCFIFKFFTAGCLSLSLWITMLSTANATWDRPLRHTMMLGIFVGVAMIGQVSIPDSVPKNEMFSLTNKNRVTHFKMYLSYRQLAKGWGVGKNKHNKQTAWTIVSTTGQNIWAKNGLCRKREVPLPTLQTSMVGPPRYAMDKGYLPYTASPHLVPRQPGAIE